MIEQEQSRFGNGEAATLMAFELEQHGQDASLTLPREVRLIQFKYSSRGTAIEPAELAEILTALNVSEQSLEPSAENVKWVLRTNRSLSPQASAILSGGTPETIRKSRNPAAQETIQRLGPRLAVERYDLADYERALADRARLFGIDDCSRVTDRVIGMLMNIATQPRGHRQLRLSDLDEALTGFRTPAVLWAGDVSCRARRAQELEELARSMGGVRLHEAIPRSGINELLATPGVALAVVTGHGGSGKSLSVLRGLYDLLQLQNRLVGVLSPAGAVSSFPSLVASWRAPHGTPAESFDASLRRLAVANEELPRPILVLALDGIDEQHWQERHRREAEELLAYFSRLQQSPEVPPATLVVTCRTRDELDQMLAPEGTGGPPTKPPLEAPLGEFSASELLTLWRQWFPGEAAPSIGADDAAALGEMPRTPWQVRLGRALRNPVMLGRVKELGVEGRADLIAGNDRAWRALVTKYLDWFITKSTRRLGGSAVKTKQVLQAAADATTSSEGESATFDRESHWTEPARRTTDLPVGQIRAIFGDAVTAGLIDADGLPRYHRPQRVPVPWRWHFDFVPQHLVTLA